MGDSKHIGRYRLGDELGSGAMGTVYSGTDTASGATVAIKQLRSEVATPDLVARFRRECQVLRELNHPNIVKTLDTLEVDGQHYLVMEYMSGGDLATLLKRDKPSVETMLKISLDLVDALTRAHKLHIIHRDLKPENVLIAEDGVVRLTDFGVAHVRTKSRLTDADTIVGTVGYLPPEALEDATYDEQGDIWAFGVLLFEMLTGQPLFTAETLAATISAILTAPIPDLETLAPDAPVGLIDLIYRMLDRDRNTRIRSARHIGAALEDILQGRDHRVAPGRFETTHEDAIQRPKHNLPAHTTPFVGRDYEVDSLAELLRTPSARLVTILAPGGMGKTRLSLAVAEQQIASFADGVYLVELAPLDEPGMIAATIAEAIGVQFQSDGRSSEQQLADFLSVKSMLLVLDNFEHLLDGATLVSTLLQAAPQVKVLATSRGRLAQPGETLFRLGGMGQPDEHDAAQALDHPAVRLFESSARRANPNFVLDETTVGDVARVCRTVQGMPLAIVLAASWSSMLTLAEIITELDQSLDFLETDEGDLPQRQRSIRVVLDYSWNQMSTLEQQVFMRFSVFRGGFTREAAQTIGQANLRTLLSLTNKSLVRRVADTGRYEIHELMRQFGETHLAADPAEEAETKRAHAVYYLRLVGGKAEDLNYGNERAAVRIIEQDLNNVYLAWHWALAHQAYDLLYFAEGAFGMFRELDTRFLETESLYEETERRLVEALPGREQEALLAQILAWRAWNALRFGELERGLAICQRSWHLLEKLDGLLPSASDPRTDPRTPMVIIYAILGQTDTGRQIAHEMVTDYTQAGDRRNLGIGLGYYALTAVELAAGQYEAVREYAQMGYKLFREFNHRYIRSYLLNNWGNAEAALGNLDEARRIFQESYEAMRAVGSAEGQASALNSLASIALSQGDMAEGKRIYQQNLETYREIGDVGGQMLTSAHLGEIAVHEGDLTRAAENFSQALTVANTNLGDVTLTILLQVEQLLQARGFEELAIQICQAVAANPAVSEGNRHEAQARLAQADVEHDTWAAAPSLDDLIATVLNRIHPDA